MDSVRLLIKNIRFVCVAAVCVPCMSVRMETELKARLCYTNAKIYIKLLNEEREETQPISTPNGTDEVILFAIFARIVFHVCVHMRRLMLSVWS